VSTARPSAKKVSLLAAAALAMAATASGCSSDASGNTVKGIHLVAKDTLTVCTHLPYKPFQYSDDNGDVVGFDVDLTGLLAKKLGVEQKIVDVDWNQVTSGAAFKAGKCDVGQGGMTITPEREKAILISEPYFNATQALLTKTSSGVKSLADLKGKKVGVQTDTTGEIYGNKYAKQYGYTTVTFDDYALEVNAVKAGNVDAAINDNGVLYDFVKSNPDTTVAQEFDTGEKYGFAAEKNDANATKMMNMLNDAMDEAKSDGTMDKLFKKWFGKVPSSVNG
jgi:polar amino acid transport system substrate-binding protein